VPSDSYGILNRGELRMIPARLLTWLLAPTFFVLALHSQAVSCTIWAATGEIVQDGGSIIAKNRDNLSGTYTVIKAVYPQEGLPFYGIFDIEANGYVTAGVNIKGVSVVNASPNSVPKKKRHVATEDLTERLLKSYDSVDAMLVDKKLFQRSHPAIYVVGDNRKIASIEIAPAGEVAIAVKERGHLALTNHYVDNKLAHANERLSRNSTLRLRHINELLERHQATFTMNDFVLFSEEKDGGSDKAIWRVQTPSVKIRTLATWVIYLPVKGTPILYVKLANPEEPEGSYKFTLDDIFWKQRKEEALASTKQTTSK
jgi:isopenicillin-N N-acyltransferase like protein